MAYIFLSLFSCMIIFCSVNHCHLCFFLTGGSQEMIRGDIWKFLAQLYGPAYQWLAGDAFLGATKAIFGSKWG